MDVCFHSSEDYRQRDSDQISIASTTSSTGVPSRERRLTDNSSNNIYLPMSGTRASAHSPGSNNKVSPTPPKKPPRRNLSVSPTHITPMSMSADGTAPNHAYEYLFLARSGARSQSDLEDLTPRTLQHHRSIDTYVEMNKRFSMAPDLQRGRSEELLDDKPTEPVAITAVYENVAIKTQNPRRKLRRHHDVYEDFELRGNASSTPNITENVRLSTFVSNAYIMLKSSEESLLDGKVENKALKRVQDEPLPLSPTHYKQPPTPDHPPPSALQAESVICDRIRPLSQVRSEQLYVSYAKIA